MVAFHVASSFLCFFLGCQKTLGRLATPYPPESNYIAIFTEWGRGCTESCSQLSVCHSIPACEIATFTLRWVCSIVGGAHVYTQDLILLEQSPVTFDPDQERELSHPPLPPEKWDAHLSRHPDSVFIDFIRCGWLPHWSRAGVTNQPVVPPVLA